MSMMHSRLIREHTVAEGAGICDYWTAGAKWDVLIFTIYKAYDMIFFDWFLLCRFHFFQYYCPEVAPAYNGRKYGYNLKSQLLKLREISRQIVNAFYDYTYNEADTGLIKYISAREDMVTYIHGIVRAAHRSGVLYTNIGDLVRIRRSLSRNRDFYRLSCMRQAVFFLCSASSAG